MIQWIAFAFSSIGILLNAKKDIRCWPVWVVSNVLWLFYTFQNDQIAAFCTWCMFLIFNFYGWYKWSIQFTK